MTDRNTDATKRERSITWQDPMAAAEAAPTMSGLDYLQAMVEGKLPAPPIAALMNFVIAEVKKERVVFTVEPAEYHYNPIGIVHGGLAATLLDSVMSCAVQTILPAGVAYTTVELKVNFIRPITVDTGQLQGIGQLVHAGRRLATAEGRLVDADGKLYSHGTTTCMIFSPEANEVPGT